MNKPIYAKNEGGNDFAPIPQGTYPTRCYSMIHIGTVVKEFNGKPKDVNEVRITWELPTELKEFKQGDGEKPYVISRDFTLSMHEKSTLRAFLKGWRGKDFSDEEARMFDVTKLIGATGIANIVHTQKDGKTYANIVSVSPPMKGMDIPPPINKSQILTYLDFDFELFKSLPDFLRKKIESTPEYSNMMSSNEAHFSSNEQSNDDLPF